MLFNTRIFTFALASLAFINLAQAGNLVVKNMCSFPIYCYSSSAANAATVPTAPPYEKVAAGGSMTGAYPANDVSLIQSLITLKLV